MAKYLVTGGAGFIGSHLVDKLINQGDKVIVIDNLSTGKKKYINSNAIFYQTDICSDKKMKQIFKKENFDFVFHLAAQTSVVESIGDPFQDNKVNAIGSLNIFKNCVDNGIKKIVFFSTGGAIYGDVEKAVKEDHLPNPDSPYAIHKFVAEKYLEILHKINNLNYIILRPGNIYGPRQYKGGEGAVIAVFTYNNINNKKSIIYGDGLQTRDYVYVDDVVNVALIAIKSNIQGVFNISNGRALNIFDLIKVIEKVTNRKFKYEHQSSRSGEVKNSVLDISKAKKVLRWKPTTALEKGIKETINWAKEN
ncbi:MAG: NAD-dependent epimerase/dehydratase family protein [Candidatus Portnoybacteria bacterium]